MALTADVAAPADPTAPAPTEQTPAAGAATPAAPELSPIQAAIAARREAIAAQDADGAAEDAPEPTIGAEPGAEPAEPDAGAPAADGEADGEGEDDAELVVELPGRRPEDPPLKHRAASAEEADRLRQLANGYMRSSEIREARAEIARFQGALEQDPVGFFLAADEKGNSYVPTEVRRDLVLQMVLADETLYESIVTELAELDADEVKRRERRLDYREQQQKRAGTVEREAEVRAQTAGALEAAVATIAELLPAGVELEAFEDAVLGDLALVAQRDRLTPDQLTPDLVRRIAALHGAVPAGAAAAPNAGPPPAGGAPAARAAAPAPAATEAGKRLVVAQQRKRAAAATAPAGAGAAPVQIAPPAGQSVKDRIAWRRQQLSAAPAV